jgi:hypothetical protein
LPENVVAARSSVGGTAQVQVRKQIEYAESKLLKKEQPVS